MSKLLQEKINRREAALRASEAETVAREAELQELKESLQKLQSTRGGIRDAIEDALSDRNIEPTDILEAAVGGNTRDKPFANGSMTAEEAVRLALTSMRNELGPKRLVKTIIRSAVEVSGLDAEGVIKAALDTVRGSDLGVRDVVLAALQGARNSTSVAVSEIMRPAVEISMELGGEVPLIVQETFVAAARGWCDPSLVRSCVLSVLGCAVGMGMNYKGVKGVFKEFSREVKHGAHGQRASDGKKDLIFTPPELEDHTSPQPQQTQTPQSSDGLIVCGDYLEVSIPHDLVNGALDSINDGGPGLYPLSDGSSVVAESESAKRGADDDDTEPEFIPRKKVKARL